MSRKLPLLNVAGKDSDRSVGQIGNKSYRSVKIVKYEHRYFKFPGRAGCLVISHFFPSNVTAAAAAASR